MAFLDGFKDQFLRLQHAAYEGDLILLDCTRATGERVAVVMTIEKIRGDYKITPVAELIPPGLTDLSLNYGGKFNGKDEEEGR